MDAMKSIFPMQIVGGTVFSRYPTMQGGVTYNMIVTGQKDSKALVSFAGYSEMIDFLVGVFRGVFLSTNANEIVIVYGSAVYLVNSNLNYRFLSQLDSSTGDVYITENANSQITLVDGDRMYVYNYSNSSFVQPTIYFRPVYVDFIDGFTIATFDDGRWGIDTINNSLLWADNDWVRMNNKADKVVAVVVLNRQIWVLGEKCGELWSNQGATDFPFVLDSSLSINYGAANRSTIASGFDKLVWLGKSELSGYSIMATDGGVPYAISNEGLDFHINKLVNPKNSTGFLYKLDGHTFYFINFLDDNFSIQYDFNTGNWYTMTGRDIETAHIAKKGVFYLNKLFIASKNDAKFREMSTEIYDYDGEEIPRGRICPSFKNADDKTSILNKVNIQMEYGHTNSPSKVQLSLSRDGGYSFGTTVTIDLPEYTKRIGTTRFRPRYRSNDVTAKFLWWSKGRVVVTNSIMELLHK
jgi:hypothetical protein